MTGVQTCALPISEQLGELDKSGHAAAGRLIWRSPVNDEASEIEDYATATAELACNDQVRSDIGQAAQKYVSQTFDQQNTLPSFMSEMLAAEPQYKSGLEAADSPVSLCLSQAPSSQKLMLM